MNVACVGVASARNVLRDVTFKKKKNSVEEERNFFLFRRMCSSVISPESRRGEAIDSAAGGCSWWRVERLLFLVFRVSEEMCLRAEGD